MKGILLAGGSGTLMRAGIRDACECLADSRAPSESGACLATIAKG